MNVCLKEAVYEPLSGADFPAGWQKLDGPQALSFVRQRHDPPRGDLDRVVRQQVVMAQLAHQVISGRTLTSPATMSKLEDAIQRSVVLSSGWDIMDFIKQLEHLAGGNVAFATIPVVDEAGWSDDGMQSVVRVNPTDVHEWVDGLLHDQAEGKTEQIAYSPDKTTADVVNDTNINGLASAVSDVLSAKGFAAGTVGNNDKEHVTKSQVQAPGADDLGAQAVARTSADCRWSRTTRSPRATSGWCWPATTPAPGPASRAASPTAATVDQAAGQAGDADPPPPSPVITAGSDDPKCVN